MDAGFSLAWFKDYAYYVELLEFSSTKLSIDSVALLPMLELILKAGSVLIIASVLVWDLRGSTKLKPGIA